MRSGPHPFSLIEIDWSVTSKEMRRLFHPQQFSGLTLCVFALFREIPSFTAVGVGCSRKPTGEKRNGDITAGARGAAREAYARSLLEDLAFYPAHQRLGAMALADGDTAAAVAEFELTAASASNEPLPHTFLGLTYFQLGHFEDAYIVLERATSLEPYYAEPFYMLGLVCEALEDREAAIGN